MDRAMLRRHLAHAEWHIAVAREHVSEQQSIVDRLEAAGHGSNDSVRHRQIRAGQWAGSRRGSRLLAPAARRGERYVLVRPSMRRRWPVLIQDLQPSGPALARSALPGRKPKQGVRVEPVLAVLEAASSTRARRRRRRRARWSRSPASKQGDGWKAYADLRRQSAALDGLSIRADPGSS
jgi:hypothetical protein